MPNAKVLKEKQKIVEELTEKLRSKAGVLVDYSGITVNEDTEMRVKMREANVEYTVVKNTLMRFAIKNVGFEELDPILNGTTSLALSYDDPVAPARIIKEYSEKLTDYFEIKGGFMEGRVLSVSEVNTLASIPPMPILQAKLLGTMLAPIATLAMVLKAIAEKGGETVIAEIAPAEEAPAEAAPVVDAPVEDAPAETASAEETPVAEAPAEAATAEETPVEATATEAAKAEEAPEEATPSEEAPQAEAAQAETPPAEEAPAEKASKETAPKESKTPKEPAKTPEEKSNKTKRTAKAKATEEELKPAEEQTTGDNDSAEQK